jgi:histidyl-tRNA synthetase
MPAWQRVTGEIEHLCGLYGYRKILTPVFEDTALFARTSGEGSDVVQKEMYTFADRSDRSLTLRPEGTAPICRAYVEHGMHREPQPVKLFTIAPMYRYGAPGRGRYREHWQASVEALGSEDPSLDAELIQLYDTLLGRLGVKRYHLELNSIGCRECRPAYLERLTAWLDDNAPRLDDETRAKIDVSPLRVFDNYAAKPAAVRETLEGAPKIGESLCDACVAHFEAVPGTSTRRVSGTRSSRPSFAASTTTRGRRSSSWARSRTRTPRSREAVVTTASSSRSEGRRRRASASAPGSSAS